MSRRHAYRSDLSHRTGNSWVIFYIPVTHDNISDKRVSLTNHDVGLCEEWQQASRDIQLSAAAASSGNIHIRKIWQSIPNACGTQYNKYDLIKEVMHGLKSG